MKTEINIIKNKKKIIKRKPKSNSFDHQIYIDSKTFGIKILFFQKKVFRFHACNYLCSKLSLHFHAKKCKDRKKKYFS